VQGWRTIAAVARELEITDRTLRKRLKEAGIHPARPGRTSMLSDTDVTNLMEESRRRSKSSRFALEPQSLPQRARYKQDLLTDIQELKRLIDGDE